VHDLLVQFDASNFWFMHRNQIIMLSLGNFFPKAINLLEIGCGTGLVLSGISKRFPEISLFGAEAYSNALKYSKKRVKNAEFAQMSVYRLPFLEEFHVVGAFDVLEHLDDDVIALKEIFKATKTCGGIILTVPQHPWLWTPLDNKAGHKRRYTRRELRSKVQMSGFEILSITSFVTMLFPLMLVSRWRKYLQKSDQPNDILKELNIPRKLNRLFVHICSWEAILIQNGFSLPFGGSLLCVARKKLTV